MGRWTVEEWRMAQAQQRYSSHEEVHVDVHALGHEDGVFPLAVLYDDDSDGFEDEDENEDDYDYEVMQAYRKPLPTRPGRGIQPSPPPKTPTRVVPVVQAHARPPAEGEGGCVRKLLRVIRGKGGKPAGTSTAVAEKPGRPAMTKYKYQEPRTPRTPRTPRSPRSPRTPDGRRAREFVVSPRSPVTVKRPAQKSKSKSKVKANPKAVVQEADVYAYPGRQGLQIFVSTQTTAMASAPDAGRPRAFFPRSSSLAATQRANALLSQSVPVPVPPLPEPLAVQHPRALPPLPAAPRNNIPPVMSRSTQRVRPLPVPVRAPP
ncbi:hypothetical protein FB451DRAFT_308926 [Mycena latifolia]|nr:hypothetical protein FB451DRAFT_308926 [Mycena latifolia]